eukprot:332763-Chlamydomonas_euryale.AAC.6
MCERGVDERSPSRSVVLHDRVEGAEAGGGKGACNASIHVSAPAAERGADVGKTTDSIACGALSTTALVAAVEK